MAGYTLPDEFETRIIRTRNALIAWATEQRHATSAVFITLTFRQRPSPKFARTAIRSFIDKLRRKYRIRSYFWLAELQRNGFLHFHIALPDAPYIHWRWLRGAWPWGGVFVCRRDFKRVLKYLAGATKRFTAPYQRNMRLFKKLYPRLRAFSHNRLRTLEARAAKFPAWLREIILEKGEIPKKIRGGAWIFSDEEIVKPIWNFVWREIVPGVTRIVAILERIVRYTTNYRLAFLTRFEKPRWLEVSRNKRPKPPPTGPPPQEWSQGRDPRLDPQLTLPFKPLS